MIRRLLCRLGLHRYRVVSDAMALRQGDAMAIFYDAGCACGKRVRKVMAI